MPTYEYACGACAHEWEVTQRITEAPIEVCPKCAQATAHRLISGGTNFILKGGGWYSDLYATPKSASKPSEEKASTESGSGSKPEKGGAAQGEKADSGGTKSAETDSSNKSTAKAASSEKPAPSSSSTPS